MKRSISILVITIALIFMVAVVGCSSPNEGNIQQPNENQDVGAVNDEEMQGQPNETKESSKKVEEDEYTNTAEEAELFTGEFIVGEDVVPGRYEVTSLDGSGNFFVYDGEMPIVNEILTDESGVTSVLGVTRLEIDLHEGNKIDISGINTVLLAPAEISLKMTLPSGNHLVGRDVPAGNYVATTPNGSGNFIVYDGVMPVVNEILGDSDFAVDRIKLTLKDGQMIQISGLEEIELTE